MNEKVQAGLEFLKRYEGIGFAVRDIEDALGLECNTLASAFNVLEKDREEGEAGLKRVGVVRPGSSRVYQGFMYVVTGRTEGSEFVVRGFGWAEKCRVT
ncbi:hypothetical protein ABH935_004121 [Catenulispora sp. GAS73]|uniref:hypothetical protein n=1 Tax=Catenulispora sp. GAS73 TaxID=3156269 RepID=UPI003513120A